MKEPFSHLISRDYYPWQTRMYTHFVVAITMWEAALFYFNETLQGTMQWKCLKACILYVSAKYR